MASWLVAKFPGGQVTGYPFVEHRGHLLTRPCLRHGNATAQVTVGSQIICQNGVRVTWRAPNVEITRQSEGIFCIQEFSN